MPHKEPNVRWPWACGTFKPVVGFRPQYFSQNEDTYRVLDELGMGYNSGFKAGLLYAPGHETDATLYAVEGHDFRAVPFTTAVWQGKDLYLCDIANALVNEMSGAE